MTPADALCIMRLKHHPAVTDAQLKRQKQKICSAAKKWRQMQKTGMLSRIAEDADVTPAAVCKFEAGLLCSAKILRIYMRAGFDVEPVKIIKALDGCANAPLSQIVGEV